MTVLIVGVCLIVIALCWTRAHLHRGGDRCPHCGKDLP